MVQATARHLLVSSEEQCQALKQQIMEGADFAQIARAHSSCPSGAQGGELGSFGPGMMVREFDEVVFSFIPNPVIITQTEGRIDNQLNQKLNDANRGRFHFLDPTPVLLKGGKQYFFQSDSHWNQMGAKQWLGQLNQYLLLL